AQGQAISKEEQEANEKRWQESGGGVGSSDQWRWTLNWNDISPEIVVGSCPRSPSDVVRIKQEAGATAILCLQSDLCHEAMQIDWPAIRAEAVSEGVIMTRVAVRDFDHNDQALMLPEAVRMLYLLIAAGKKVYVHCTAGINRATLTVVGYFTFVKAMPLQDALHKVKSARAQANPYVDCWKTVRTRMLEGRTDEIVGLAKHIYRQRQERGEHGNADGFADWVRAEELLLQETFQRQLGCSLSLLSSLKEVEGADLARLTEDRGDEVAALQAKAKQEQAHLTKVTEELNMAKEQLASFQASGGSSKEGLSDGESVLAELDRARQEIAGLRTAMQEVAANTQALLHAARGNGLQLAGNGQPH
ncbi:hypothetical protein WJX84_009299, partial [Apatococcus fuscideae]